jgi:hypothetical protein
VRSTALKRIEALEKLAATRLAEEAERARAAERFERKLEAMTVEERAEIESIQAFFENTADRLGLHEPLGPEGELAVIRNTPAEMRHRYSEILGRYKD